MATMLTMTATVKAIDSQRWVCRIHLFQFNWTSLRLFNTELLGILGVQPLPAAELHGVGAGDAANGSSAQEPLQDVERDVPARGAPRDEAAIDVVPQSQARAATKGFEF